MQFYQKSLESVIAIPDKIYDNARKINKSLTGYIMSRRTFSREFFFFSLFSMTVAQATTVEETVITVIETNPSISVEEATARADEFEIDVARSGFFPSLDIVASSAGYQKFKLNEKQDPPLSFREKGQVTHLVTNPTVVLSQTLFDGFATLFAVERAQQQAKVSYAVVGQTLEQVAFDATSAFINLLAQQQLLEVADEIIKKHQEILEKVKKRVAGGISTVADVYQVESRLEDAFVIKERTEGQLEVAFADFIEVVGFRPEDKLETPLLPQEPIEPGLECILTRVSQNNPRVIVETNNLYVAEAALDQTISPFMPTIRAQLVSNSPVINPTGITGRENIYTAQLVLDYNLFAGGKNISELRAQRERVVAAKKRVDVTRRTAAKVSHEAWAKYVSSNVQIQELIKSVEVNYKLYRAYELQFALVSRPLFELLEAYVSYYRSKIDLINAGVEKDTNHALLLASMGELICSMQQKRLQE